MKKAIKEVVSGQELLRVMLKKVLGASEVLADKYEEAKERGEHDVAQLMRYRIKEQLEAKAEKIKDIILGLAEDVAHELEKDADRVLVRYR